MKVNLHFETRRFHKHKYYNSNNIGFLFLKAVLCFTKFLVISTFVFEPKLYTGKYKNSYVKAQHQAIWFQPTCWAEIRASRGTKYSKIVSHHIRHYHALYLSYLAATSTRAWKSNEMSLNVTHKKHDYRSSTKNLVSTSISNSIFFKTL